MRAPPAIDLLAAWEQGQAEPPRRRALLLLTVACDDVAPEEIARWSIGTRDAALLRLRERLFGDEFKSWTACPRCAERVEFQLQGRTLLGEASEPPVQSGFARWKDCEAEFRLPTSLDLESLLPGAPPAENRVRLLAQCLLSLQRKGRDVPPADCPPELAAAIAMRMAEIDPRSDLRLDLLCPACRHPWQATFDIVSYLWTEVHAWATRLLREVHEIACSYGWSEAEILALSPFRRQQYLDLVRG